MSFSLNRTVEPSIEPVTLDQLKSQVHITFTEQDATLSSYLLAGRIKAEEYRRESFITQTWKLTLDNIPRCPIKLLRGPVQSLVSVTVYDGDNASTVVDNSNFFLDTASNPGRLSLTDSGEWPNIVMRSTAAIEIVYTAGYGSNVEEVPEYIKQAIILYASHADDNRVGEDMAIPQGFYNLLKPGRINVNSPW